jgi:hypothetical protein
MSNDETLYWAENAAGYVYLSLPGAPLKPGFQRFSTRTPSEMDRIFAKLDRQEKKFHAEMTEQIFNRGAAWIDQNRSNIRNRMAQSNSEGEKEVLRAWLKAFDNRMDKLMKNTVYGVSAMQTTEAPLDKPRGKVMTIEDIRLGKLELDLSKLEPATETIQ